MPITKIIYTVKEVAKELKGFNVTEVYESSDPDIEDDSISIEQGNRKFSIQVGEGYLCLDESFENESFFLWSHSHNKNLTKPQEIVSLLTKVLKTDNKEIIKRGREQQEQAKKDREEQAKKDKENSEALKEIILNKVKNGKVVSCATMKMPISKAGLKGGVSLVVAIIQLIKAGKIKNEDQSIEKRIF